MTLVIALVGVAGCGFACSALANSLTDTISVTIEKNCMLEYGSTAHEDGAGVWDDDTLSVAMKNGVVNTNIGSTNFNAICNDAGGYSVSLDITALKDEESNAIITFSGSEPTRDVSPWDVWNGIKWVTYTLTYPAI
jgi:hypothetical protein